jgi:hypothetical protein
METEDYLLASSMEKGNPREALERYRKLIKGNKRFYPSILIAGIVAPSIAFAIAVLVTQPLSRYRELTAILIICIIGFGPVILLSSGKDKEVIKGSAGLSLSDSPLVLNFFIVPFGGLLQMAVVGVVTAIIFYVILLPVSFIRYLVVGGPMLWPTKLPAPLTYPVFLTCFLIVCLVLFSDVRLLPLSARRIIKEVPIGLRYNALKIPYALVSLLWILSIIVFGFKGTRNIAIIGSATLLVGLLLGFMADRKEENYSLGALYQMGKARALVRLNRLMEARFLLMLRLEDKDLFNDKTSRNLGKVLHGIIDERIEQPEDRVSEEKIFEYLDDLEKTVESSDPLREVYMDTIKRINELAEGK